MHTLRKQILQNIKETGSTTVAELATALEMVPVSVRHHLDILQGENLIRVEKVRRKGGVGRPSQVYILTENAEEHFPDNCATLAAGLVHQLKEILPPDQVNQSFCAMARQIAAEFQSESTIEFDSDRPRVGGEPISEERVSQVVTFLNERGYLARWERSESRAAEGKPAAELKSATMSDADCNTQLGEDVFVLHTYNCPYSAISSEHSELCLMDQILINELVGQPCERIGSLAEGSNSCTYRIVRGGQGLAL